jgi:nucleoside-diphosphate-sugar epimerase
MRVLIAGATGVVGRCLTPMLLAAGHGVSGITRNPDRAAWLEALGATPVVIDVRDAPGLLAVVAAARPDVVVHQLTDLSAGYGPESLAANARLRDLGTANLVAAAVAAGVSRFVAQSAAWLYAPGTTPRIESDALLDPDLATGSARITVRGVLALERHVLATAGIEGVVLRFGRLYGPGTGADAPIEHLPSVHVASAARAAAFAVDGGPRGVYNIVDDGPAVSNAKARDLLGWRP